MGKAILDKNGFATKAGNLTIYHYQEKTREYLSSSIEYIVLGVGVPAHSCVDVPGEARAGYAVRRTQDLTGWEYVADHRGETIYCTYSGAAIIVTELSDYLAGSTVLPPGKPFDIWNGTEWVTDTEKKHTADVEAAEERKSVLMNEARTPISIWQTELQLGIIDDKDKASLIRWLDYIRK